MLNSSVLIVRREKHLQVTLCVWRIIAIQKVFIDFQNSHQVIVFSFSLVFFISIATVSAVSCWSIHLGQWTINTNATEGHAIDRLPRVNQWFEMYSSINSSTRYQFERPTRFLHQPRLLDNHSTLLKYWLFFIQIILDFENINRSFQDPINHFYGYVRHCQEVYFYINDWNYLKKTYVFIAMHTVRCALFRMPCRFYLIEYAHNGTFFYILSHDLDWRPFMC